MKWYAQCELLKPRYFEIKQDSNVGFYLYVLEDGKCIFDHLQDTLEIAKERAREDYGIPKNAWKKIENETPEGKIKPYKSTFEESYEEAVEIIKS